MLQYKAIEIFTSEAARYLKKPVTDAVLAYVRDLKIASRCMVTRGIAGCYENGEMATGRLEILSYNLPVRIHVLVPEAEADLVYSLSVASGNLGIADLKPTSTLPAARLFASAEVPCWAIRD